MTATAPVVSRHAPLLLIALVAAILFAVPTEASVPTIRMKGRVLETIEFVVDVAAGQTLALYEVPKKKKLVVTDLLVSNDGGSAARLQLRRSITTNAGTDVQLATHALVIPGLSTLSHSFVMGLEFPPKSTLELVSEGTGKGITLRGYLRAP